MAVGVEGTWVERVPIGGSKGAGVGRVDLEADVADMGCSAAEDFWRAVLPEPPSVVLAADGGGFEVGGGIGVAESLAGGSNGVPIDPVEVHSDGGRVRLDEPKRVRNVVVAHEDVGRRVNGFVS